MFYSYPSAATSDNWLHWCLILMLVRILDDFDNGNDPPAWPIIIPTQYRETLRRRRGLSGRLNAFIRELRRLSLADRSNVRETLIRQNQLRQLLSCHHSCKALNELPDSIHDSAKDLFEYAFGLLKDLRIRDELYRVVYESTAHKVCPFCGCEPFDAPGARREDLDHYLPRSRYPFAGVNLRNLVPMGRKCNSLYKGETDPLHDESGGRRRVLNPYAGVSFGLSVLMTGVFDIDNVLGLDWRINFVPASEESETWDEIFHVRERLERDVFEPYWTEWLGEFVVFANELRSADDVAVQDALIRYCRVLRRYGLRDHGFLRLAFFELVLYEVDAGNQQLVRLLGIRGRQPLR